MQNTSSPTSCVIEEMRSDSFIASRTGFMLGNEKKKSKTEEKKKSDGKVKTVSPVIIRGSVTEKKAAISDNISHPEQLAHVKPLSEITTAIPLADQKLTIPLTDKGTVIPPADTKVLATIWAIQSIPSLNISPINEMKKNAGKYWDGISMADTEVERDVIVNEVQMEDTRGDVEHSKEAGVISKIKIFELDMENCIMEINQTDWEVRDYSTNSNLDFIFKLAESYTTCNKHAVDSHKTNANPPSFIKGDWVDMTNNVKEIMSKKCKIPRKAEFYFE
eukprot:4589576-Ditylum_brightwellii.AAC.2